MTINEESIKNDEPNMSIVEEEVVMIEGKTVAEALDILHEGIFHSDKKLEHELGLEALEGVAARAHAILAEEEDPEAADLEINDYIIAVLYTNGGAMGASEDGLVFTFDGQEYTITAADPDV